MKSLRFCTFGLLILLITSCHFFKNTSIANRSKNEDFDLFYKRFHEDFNFQNERVLFPLEGMKIDGESQENWSRNNFIPLRTKHFDIDQSKYKVETERTQDSFIQKIYLEDSGFYSEYRFKPVKNKWYLVYVLDQNL
jgi:hypothetical protein